MKKRAKNGEKNPLSGKNVQLYAVFGCIFLYFFLKYGVFALYLADRISSF